MFGWAVPVADTLLPTIVEYPRANQRPPRAVLKGVPKRQFFGNLGAVSIRKTVLPGMAIPMLKIRRPNGRLIFNMEIAIRR